MLESNIKNTVSNNILVPLMFLLIVWGAAFFNGIDTAIAVWSVSEIFAHCFLVLPCSLYFIYLKRYELQKIDFAPNYLLFPVFISLLVLQVFAEIGDIKVLQHMATFSALPILLWLYMGNEAAKVIKFPLFFMVFSIPIGEQLIPHLQDVTTNIAVPLIELSGVPIFRNGYYLDIPQGRFLVAEACSGISFLIASVVFGCLYAYMSFKHLSKQLIFVGVSIALPIIANAIRVFGIVLTAYLTDMEYAAGADHIIYGGVFYSFIIFMLILIGEKYRDKDFDLIAKAPISNIAPEEDRIDSSNEQQYTDLAVMRKSTTFKYIALIILVLIISQQLWKYSISHGEQSDVAIDIVHLKSTPEESVRFDWQPLFNDPAVSQSGSMKSIEQGDIDYFISTHTHQTGELISGQNYLYNNEKWSLLSRENIQLTEINQEVALLKLVSAQGTYRYLVTWYQLDQQIVLSNIKMKLLQAVELMKGNQPISSVFAFSIKGENLQVRDRLLSFIKSEQLNFKKVISYSSIGNK